jgi:hypothetical protein
VSETIDLKGKGLMCHTNQFGPEANMVERIRERAAQVAQDAKEKQSLNMQYAEAFRRIKLHIPPESKEDVPEAEQ